MSLAEARAILARLAAGDPPADWPVGVFDEKPVPKCSAFLCPEPGIYHVKVASLVEVSSSSTYSCRDHLEHFHAAALDWVLH